MGRKMSNRFIPTLSGSAVVAAVSLVVFSCSVSQEKPFETRAARIGLAWVKDVPLPGSASRLDYQSIDEDRRRLYIAHLGADMVTVFDIDAQKVIGNIGDVSRPHGILAVASLGKVFVSATGRDELVVIDENTLRVDGRIPAGHYPDGIAFDPKTQRVFVSDETGMTVAVIDPAKMRLVKKIEMGGEVGNTQCDTVSGMVYSAVQSTGELVAIEPVNLEIMERFKLPGCKGPHGFSIVPSTHCAVITGEGNASYVVFDLINKKVISSGSVGDDPDVLALDVGRHTLYVSSESGVVSVFDVNQKGVSKVRESLFAPHAHTVSVDQRTHQVFFPLQNVNGHPVLRIMKPVSGNG